MASLSSGAQILAGALIVRCLYCGLEVFDSRAQDNGACPDGRGHFFKILNKDGSYRHPEPTMSTKYDAIHEKHLALAKTYLVMGGRHPYTNGPTIQTVKDPDEELPFPPKALVGVALWYASAPFGEDGRDEPKPMKSPGELDSNSCALFLHRRFGMEIVTPPLLREDPKTKPAAEKPKPTPFPAGMMRCLHCGEQESSRMACSRERHDFSPIKFDCAEGAMRTVLRAVRGDPESEGQRDTPGRVIRALAEMTRGYEEDPKEILGKEFDAQCHGMVVLSGIDFTSLCEHHLLPFVGTVDLGYVPGEKGKVVGLSKLARLVDCFARRFQLQERMTIQIASSLMDVLGAKGAAVVVKAHHSCMGCRGVKKQNAVMVTSEMLGVFRDKPEARAEFLSLCAAGGS